MMAVDGWRAFISILMQTALTVYVDQLHPTLCYYAQRGAMFWQNKISLFLIQMRYSKCQ